MTIVLSRDDRTPQRTFGTLTFPDGFVCQTLEDPVRTGPKVPGDTAIPLGTYRITITHSKRFQKMLPLIHDVPGFGGVRIHAGNSTNDTSGCVLVGTCRNVNPEAALQMLKSRAAMTSVMTRISTAIAYGDSVWLNITQHNKTTQ